MKPTLTFPVIVPAAGVGKRMQADCPKQYLLINNETVLSHTVMALLSHPKISQIVLVLSESDRYFSKLALAEQEKVLRVNGGKERVNSVLNGLKVVDQVKYPWVLVHDAARPCVTHTDIDKLISSCLTHNSGGVLATPVRDTMKRSKSSKCAYDLIKNTVEREDLWHALTPQLYKTQELTRAIEQGIAKGLNITDESSAIEYANLPSLLVSGSSENIKITHPNDLVLAKFYLNKDLSYETKG
jgi:2-C-methyl-D-erythritol 4-phosphate cytidylyltransferase